MLYDLGTAVAAFVVLFLIFRPYELAHPAWPQQRFFRPRWSTDLAFFLGQYLVWVSLVLVVLSHLMPWLHSLVPPAFRAGFNAQPWALQLFEVIVLGDLLIYWAHRAQHHFDCLWRFHSVHHSSEHLDWLAAHREHPLDTIYSVVIMNLPLYLIGIPLDVMAQFVTFRGLWAIFIHSNVRINLGRFGLLVGSPAFHHWHHDKHRTGVNFGNVSPLMDVLFGTHFDPGYEPTELGLQEAAPNGYWGLLSHPFRL